MSPRTLFRILLVGLVMAGAIWTAENYAQADRGGEGGRGDGGVIYVVSQGLYYDAMVTADPVPPKGPFQELWIGMNGLETDWGPGDPGYVGGRWKLNTRTGEFRYFVCPLLGPGRETP